MLYRGIILKNVAIVQCIRTRMIRLMLTRWSNDDGDDDDCADYME